MYQLYLLRNKLFSNNNNKFGFSSGHTLSTRGPNVYQILKGSTQIYALFISYYFAIYYYYFQGKSLRNFLTASVEITIN